MNLTRTRPSGRALPPDLLLPCGLLLLLLALAAAGVGYRVWLGLNDREPLLAGLPAGGAHQREVPPTRQVRRAVLIIADGLDAELALGLQPLRLLQVAGVLAEAEAAAPTVSRASYVAWLAGLDPVDSGVRTNRYGGPLPLDSLPSRARAGGLRSLGYDEGSQPMLAELFGPHLSTRLSGRGAWPQALAGIRQADLSVLSLTSADDAGHQHGAASAQYREAAATIALRVAEVRAALDLSQDLLLVVNDHGHLPGGGHAGGEPGVRRLFLVGAGAGLSRGLKGRMNQKDLAPTLAHLLGLLPPAHNRGWSLGWALDRHLDPTFFEAAFATQYPARHRVERYLAEELGVALSAGRSAPRAEDLVRATVGNLGEARRLGWHVLQVLQGRVEEGQRQLLARLRVRRGLWVGIPLVLTLGLLVAAARYRLLRVGVGGALLALLPLATVTAILYVTDVRPTLSHPGPRDLWMLRILAAGAGAALLHLILAFVLPGSTAGAAPRAAPLGRLLAGAWLVSALTLAAFSLVPVAPGAALPHARLLAVALISWVCWVGYLALLGLLLALVGLRRPPPPGQSQPAESP